MVRPIAGMTYEPMNEKPFEHRCRWGTVFTGNRCDLKDGVDVKVDSWVNESTNREACIASDYVEFAAWHALCIHPHLNGFQGYDCIAFRQT